ncbi:MAG: AgmX/PglI C-terminal domain-containing protein, partial [Deltaproteobacteria bacterium]
DSWQRAKDVLELAEMFPPLPAPPVRPPAISSNSSDAAAQAGPGNSQRLPAQAASGAQLSVPPAVAGGAAQIDEPRATPVRPTPPLVQRAPMFEAAGRTHGQGPFMVFFFALSASAAAGLVLWIVHASSPRKSEAPSNAAPPAAIGLTADQVRRKLDENKPALQDCVDDALRRDPSLKVGKIHVATTIAPSGQVTAARIDRQNVDESALGACLKRATQRIVFPQFSGVGFDVDIPISVGSGE